VWLRKDQQVANALRSLIENGEWQQQLPGYRTLEQRLQVHRKVVERALSLLETEGLIAPAEPGKRRKICNRAGEPAASASRRLLMVGPKPIHACSPTHRAVLLEVLQQAEKRGWDTHFHHFDFDFPRRAVNAMKQIVADHRPTRLVLSSPTSALGKWAETAPVPCFLMGGAFLSCSGAGVAVSFSDMVCAAAKRLWNLGHRRLLIPIVSGKAEIRDHVLRDSAAGWARDIPRVQLEAMFPEQGELLPDVLRGFWPKQFARLKPTAVVVKESNELLSLLSYCNRHAIAIPGQLSVILISGDKACLWIDPSPDRFEFPVEGLCREVMHWLDLPPAKDGKLKILEAPYQAGGTAAPPPAERAQ